MCVCVHAKVSGMGRREKTGGEGDCVGGWDVNEENTCLGWTP